RARSRCWLPPQPCTNSTPGTRVRGVRKVPSMNWCWTWIRVGSRLAVIGFTHRVLEQESELVVRAAKHHGRGAGLRRALPAFERAGARGVGPGFGDERRPGGGLGAARPASAPGLFQPAGPRVAAAGAPLNRVVVAPRGVEARQQRVGRGTETA